MRQDRGIRKYENCIFALIFLAVNVILLGICFDFYYDLNDDTMMHDIMAGIYSGTPDGHNMQTLYPLGALIALCYRVCRPVPWYGLFLCLCQFASFYLIGVRLCALCGTTGSVGQKCRNRNLLRKCAVLLCLSLYLWGVCLPHLINIQYTITCAMLSAAAIFLFLTTPEGLSAQQFVVKNIPAIFLVVIAYQLRSEMLLLTFPLICLAGLCRLVEERKIFVKENLGKYGGVLGLILAGMLLSYAADRVAYGSAQWKDFREFFDARTTVYDFYPELITDDSYSDALAALGVEVYQQTLLRNYNFGLDEAIDTALLSELADYAVHEIGASKNWPRIFREKLGFYRYRTLHSGDAPYNIIVLWAYAAVFLAGALTARRFKRYAFVWQLVLLLAVRSALWMFILMRGRDPERITHSLYLAEFALLMGMLALRLRADGDSAAGRTQGNAAAGKSVPFVNTVIGRGMVRGMAVLACLVLLGALTDSVPAVRADQQRREQVNRDREAIDRYCREHAACFYFEDVYSTVAFSRRLFDGSDNGYANYDIMGGWMCKSPLYREKLRRSGIDNAGDALYTQDHVYFIMSDAEKAERGLDWIMAYYAAHNIAVTVEQADVIGDAGTYCVYQIETE